MLPTNSYVLLYPCIYNMVLFWGKLPVMTDKTKKER